MISRQRLYAAGEPFGTSCSRIEGCRRVYGGGGSDSGTPYYENQDKLLGVQADIAEGVYNEIFQPNAPKAIGALSTMADEASSGALTRRAMDTAGADAGMATGQAIASTNRNLARYGLDPHKFASDSNTVALGSAANKVDAMSKARNWGDSQKWARNQDLYSMVSGIPSQASASLGSAASGYGSMGYGADANANAESAGWGKAGGMLGSSLFSKGMKDGGKVVRRGLEPVAMKNGGKVACMADGGLMRLDSWRSRPTTGGRRGKGSSPMESFLTSMALSAGANAIKGAGTELVKKMFPSATQAPAPVATATPAPAENIAGAGTAVTEGQAVASDAASAQQAAEASQAATSTTDAAGGAAGANPYSAVINAAANIAQGRDVASSVGSAAGSAAGATTGAEIGTAIMPGVGTAAGGLIGGFVGGEIGGNVFRNGGKVSRRRRKPGLERKDMTPGGKVSGPGGPTDDKVPAQLSDGEFVLNAEAVKMVGDDKLNAINQAGLRRREERGSDAGVSEIKADGIHAAGGLGIALGSAVDEINRQRGLNRMESADARAAEAHEFNMKAARQAQADAEKLRSDQMAINSAGNDSPANYAGLEQDPMRQASANPNAAQTGLESILPQQSMAPSAGLKRSDDLSDGEKLFKKQRAMYEKALELNRPDLAGAYYGSLSKTRERLLADSLDRADRMYYGSNRSNLSGYIDTYNKYVLDGKNVASFKQNADGSVDADFGSGVQNFPKERIPELIMAIKSPGTIFQLEMNRAEEEVKARNKAMEELSKPIKVGKDETVWSPLTGETWAPNNGGGKMSVKEAGPILDDVRNMILKGTGNFDQATGQWSWNPQAIEKAAIADRLFMANPDLTPAQVAEIASKGTLGRAGVNIGGQHKRVDAIIYKGRTLLLGDEAGTPEPDNKTTGDVPYSVMKRFDGLQNNFGLTRKNMGASDPIAERVTSKNGRISSGKISSTPTPADFPRVSSSEQAARDADAGRLLVAEAGGIEGAKRDLEDLDKALKNPRLDGTQRAMLKSHRDRLESGIAAVSQDG